MSEIEAPDPPEPPEPPPPPPKPAEPHDPPDPEVRDPPSSGEEDGLTARLGG